MSANSKQQLPQKLQADFRLLVKLYEQKQYKKGLKTAEALLKQFPDHGETLSMRGLLLYHLDRKSEGFDSAKAGLKANLSSHVCWHVLGLLHRSDKNYVEAVKAYRTALRFDAENQVVLKDLANLLVFQRDFSGFVDIRRKILTSRPQIKANWFGLVLAETMTGNFGQAETLLGDLEEAFPKEMSGNAAETKFETSEALCMRMQLLDKQNKAKEALEISDSRASEIIDKVFLLETQAALANKIGNFPKAEKALRTLINRNPDNDRYVFALFFVASENSSKDLREVFEGDDLNDWKFHKISAPTISVPEISDFFGNQKFLDLLDTLPEGDGKEQSRLLISGNLCTTISDFLRRKAVKGVPNLWRLLSGVWKYRKQEISEFLPEIISELISDSSLPPFAVPILKVLEAAFSRAVGDLPAARAAAEAAVAHTPTFIEGVLWQAKLAETPADRAALYERARLLDLADRSLNSKAVKALLRADDIARASELVLLFSKETAESKQPNLVEMQCAWWSLEIGDSHFRRGDYSQALTHWKAVAAHFEEFKEDEFDFAGFCLRKGTVRPFIEFLKTQDKLKSHKNFRSAAKRLIELYAKIKTKEISLPEVANPEAEIAKLVKSLEQACPDWAELPRLKNL